MVSSSGVFTSHQLSISSCGRPSHPRFRRGRARSCEMTDRLVGSHKPVTAAGHRAPLEPGDRAGLPKHIHRALGKGGFLMESRGSQERGTDSGHTEMTTRPTAFRREISAFPQVFQTRREERPLFLSLFLRPLP